MTRITKGTLSEWLMLAAVFCLPLSAVWIVGDAGATVVGAANVFAIPRIYLIEVLVLVASIVTLVTGPKPHPLRRPAWYGLEIVVVVAFVSILWTPDRLLALTAALHLLIALCFLPALVIQLRRPGFARKLAWTFLAVATIQAVWAIAQYTLQHDLGLQRLGESVLGPDVHGVAKVNYDGERVIRAYGSLPHPNILAAYLTAAIFTAGTLVLWPARITKRSRLILTIILIVLGAALWLTFSRTALILTVINGALVLLFSYRRWHRLSWEAAVVAIAFVVVAGLVWEPLTGREKLTTAQETGINNRTVGYEAAAAMVAHQPYGVGAGNFVRAMPVEKPDLPGYQYQPAHNVPLLIAAELGIIPALLVLAYVAEIGWRFHFLRPRDRYANSINFSLFMLGGVFIGLGMVDHFLWTLPGGLLLIVMFAAVIESRLSPKPVD